MVKEVAIASITAIIAIPGAGTQERLGNPPPVIAQSKTRLSRPLPRLPRAMSLMLYGAPLSIEFAERRLAQTRTQSSQGEQR